MEKEWNCVEIRVRNGFWEIPKEFNAITGEVVQKFASAGRWVEFSEMLGNPCSNSLCGSVVHLTQSTILLDEELALGNHSLYEDIKD